MQKYGDWNAFEPAIGEGGQGSVFRARQGPDPRESVVSTIFAKVMAIAGVASRGADFWQEQQQRLGITSGELRQTLEDYDAAGRSVRWGALKVLHRPPSPEALEKPFERLRREVATLKAIDHPSLVKVLDEKIDDFWFVMTLFALGSLSDNRTAFQGRMLPALRAFRTLVDAVAILHEHSMIHRDIKPENVFLESDERLVLGDMGIVFFRDDAHTRVSETYENVGSRDWMPAWAMGVRLDDVTPAFDVFTLGKVFWSMLSGRTRLQLWYHREPAFDLEKLFPNQPDVRFARWILDDSVVEKEAACLPTAKELLVRVDECILAVSRHAQLPGRRLCRVCGLGQYVQRVDERNSGQQLNFGIQRVGNAGFRIFCCDHCGHCELFHFDKSDQPAQWWMTPKPPIRKK